MIGEVSQKSCSILVVLNLCTAPSMQLRLTVAVTDSRCWLCVPKHTFKARRTCTSIASILPILSLPDPRCPSSGSTTICLAASSPNSCELPLWKRTGHTAGSGVGASVPANRRRMEQGRQDCHFLNSCWSVPSTTVPGTSLSSAPRVFHGQLSKERYNLVSPCNLAVCLSYHSMNCAKKHHSFLSA